jgi:hypothetical protein
VNAARVATLGLAVLASVAWTSSARADDDAKPSAKTAEKTSEKGAEGGKVADDGATIETAFPPFSVRFKVITVGLLVTGAAWGVSYAAARGWPEAVCHITVIGPLDANGKPCVSGPPGSDQLGIPVVGPWIALGKSGCASDEPQCPNASIGARDAALVLDGIVQAAGLALVIEGIVMKTAPIDNGKKSSPLALQLRGVELRPIPITTPSMHGLGVTGSF